MDRVQQICAELVQLYQAQLHIWEPRKLANVNEADVLEYDKRRERIGELWKELEQMTTTHEAYVQQQLTSWDESLIVTAALFSFSTANCRYRSASQPRSLEVFNGPLC